MIRYAINNVGVLTPELRLEVTNPVQDAGA